MPCCVESMELPICETFLDGGIGHRAGTVRQCGARMPFPCVLTIEKSLAKGVGCKLYHYLISRKVLCSGGRQKRKAWAELRADDVYVTCCF